MRPDLGVRVGTRYRDWALELDVPGEARLRSRVLDRLPERLVDCHVHLNGPGAASDLSSYGWAQRRSSFPEWDTDSSEMVRPLTYGDRKVVRLRMPQPHFGIDHRRANAYVLENRSASNHAVLCAVLDDKAYTLSEIDRGEYVAVKSYPHATEPPYQTIDDFFPPWLLEAAEANGLPIILHTPTPLGECFRDLIKLIDCHPGLEIVVAHIGREISARPEAVRAFEAVSACPGVVVDVSMNTYPEVHDLALVTFGSERILFGSDEPFNLLRYLEVEDPDHGRKVVAHQPYHWNKPWALERYGGQTRSAPLIHLRVLETLFDALDRHSAGADDLMHAVFWANAHRVFGIDDPPEG